MTDEGPDQPTGPLRPTVIAVGPRKAIAPKAATAKVDLPRTATSPTLMPGSAPVRLAVDPAHLQRLAPKAGPATLDAARQMLSALIPAHMTDRQALFWAQDLQELHGKMVEDHLALMRDPLLRDMPTHLKRLQNLLFRFDLEAICTKGGLLSGVFRSTSRVIDTPAELQSARDEIEQLLRLLSGALEGLVTLKSRLELGAERMQSLGDRVEGASLAAAYLAETADPRLALAFLERHRSLATTLIQIRSAQVQHPLQAGLPARLVLAIQNIALVALPAWLERLALFQRKLASDHRPSLTEARDLSFRLADLMPLFPQPE